MKYIYNTVLIFAAIFYVFPLQATQWTVSNDPERLAQFTSIQDAIDEAESGDTILILGSSTNYTGFTLNKPMVIIGEGMEISEYSERTRVSSVNIGRQNATTSASGSRFIGISFWSTVNISGSFSGSNPGETWLEDIEFDRCAFQSNLNMSNSSTEYREITIKNCLFTITSTNIGLSSSADYQNIIIHNSVFSRGQISSSGLKDFNGELLISNSMFLNRTTDVFSNLEGIVVENCIFYLAEPTGARGSVFNNNLTYICNDNTLPPNVSAGQPENEGENNIINENPRFTDFPSLGGSFSWNQDFTLLPISPAIGAGTGGTNIGLSGGDYPVEVTLPRNSFTPVVISIDLPNSSVPENGVLQGQIEATIRN